MTNEEITQKICAIVADALAMKSISATDDFKTLDVDKLEKWDIMITTEDAFDIKISDHEEHAIESVEDLVSCVTNKLA